MYPPKKDDQTCSELQSKIEDLKWARNALKVIKDLPKGKLRDSVEHDINALINNTSATSVVASEYITNAMSILVGFRTSVLELKNKRRFTSEEITDLQRLLSDLTNQLETIRYGLNSLERVDGR
jgi:hypothetical protein